MGEESSYYSITVDAVILGRSFPQGGQAHTFRMTINIKHMLSVVFFGTQEFGASMLSALLADSSVKIIAVVTQPDRPIGRKHEVMASPVKRFAMDNGIATILQPENLKTFATEHPELASADVFVVCQYGLIIPQNVLDIPKKGTINVHTSLLPKYRGASPIQSALIHGETETGVTIMQMDAKMDHGAILEQEKVLIATDDTYTTLSAKMIPVAQKLLVDSVHKFVAGSLTPQEQQHDQATTCTMLSRDDGKIDWSKSADELYNLFRGTFPWPGVWTTWEGKRLKLLNVHPSAEMIEPGTVAWQNNQLLIGTKKGSLEILELQLEGKKALLPIAFIQGNKTIIDTKLN